jgi:hypothetical protein
LCGTIHKFQEKRGYCILVLGSDPKSTGEEITSKAKYVIFALTRAKKRFI